MAINFTSGDYIIINRAFVDKVLPTLNCSCKTQALENLGYIATNPSQVMTTGLLGAPDNKSFIRVLPSDITNPAYQSGNGVVIYFCSDAHLNNSLELSTAFIDDKCVVKVYNDSGSTITKGQVVRQTGFDATQQLPTIDLADATVPSNAAILGIMSSDVDHLGCGSVLIDGSFESLDTSGFGANDRVYLSDMPGAISTTAGTVESIVGRVLTVANPGTISIVPTLGGSGGGAMGATGVQGVTGIFGTDGVTGIFGETGISGIQGATGISAGGGGSGFFSDGTGTNAAIGKGATAPTASGDNAVAQGDNSFANANNSFASGNNVEVSGAESAAFGRDQYLLAAKSLCVGRYNGIYANGYNSLAVGQQNYNYGHYSSASIGQLNTHNGDGLGGYNFLFGDFNTINAVAGTYTTYASIAVGQGNTISYAHAAGAFGRDVDVDGFGGFGVNDRGNQCFGFGRDITLAGSNNFGLGRNINIATGSGADNVSTDQARECFGHGSNINIGRDFQKTWGSGTFGNYNSKVIRRVQTTDATPTSIFDMAVGSQKAYSVRIQMAAKVSGVSAESAAWDTSGILICPGVTIVGGGVIAPTNTNGATGGSLSFNVTTTLLGGAATGTDLQFIVTGVAATTVTWLITVEFTEVS